VWMSAATNQIKPKKTMEWVDAADRLRSRFTNRKIGNPVNRNEKRWRDGREGNKRKRIWLLRMPKEEILEGEVEEL
jgi:hypothetical protein